ncbi:MAG TPA: EAL domain-containing protein [Thermoanaerobaculia bacterium]|jgi:diguanylate cyclase (GGDEF)-like protein/PAS domain S-box-containing protein|nr:EAL domain-containing protein [Thermoanaerobaculia bacterium]
MNEILAPGELLPLSADWFRALAETTAVAIFVYDSDRFLYVNPAACELGGYEEREMLALGPDQFIVPEHRGWARASRMRRIGGDPTPARFELQIERKDGERRWLHFCGATVLWGGAPAGLGTAIDITDRICAESALRRQVRFEQAMAEVTRLFLQLPVAQLPRGVGYAFERFGPLAEVDRAQLFMFTDGAARCVTRWRADGGFDPELEELVLPVESYPYSMATFARREALRIDDDAALPSAAAAERALCVEAGIRAAVLVPLVSGERPIGFLAFEVFSGPRRWSAEVLGMLTILAEVLTGAFEREGAELELLHSRERLELAQKAGRSVVWEWDIDSDAMLLPPVSTELFGVADGAIPKSGVELMRLIPPADQELIHDALRRSIHSGEPYVLEHRVVTPQGGVRWLAVRGQLIADERGRRILGVSADVTEHKLAEEALLAEQERAAVTLASIGDGVVRTDAQGRVDYLNAVAEQLTGLRSEEALGRPLGEVYHVVDELTGQPRPNPVERCLAEGDVVVLAGQSLLLRPDGEQFAVRDSAAPVRDRGGAISGAVLVVQDVTQLRGLEREMLYLARHDSLTGLINRRELERQLEAAIASAGTGRHHCLCYLDLDEFKLVNDSCGHVAGDELLRQLTALLATHVREGDVLARLGGDEFGVLLRDCSLKGAATAAENLCRTVRRFRFSWEDRVFEVGVSIGVVPITAESGTLSQVLSAADAACYVAKEQGRNRVHLYQPDDRAMAERYGEMQWVHRIQRGFEERRFHLYQQPIRPLGTGEEMAEILLRLLGEDGEPMSTPAFIAAAERYHLMRTIDRWVVEEALQTIAARGGSAVYTINLSGQSLGDPGFLDFVQSKVREGAVPPRRLCFEITETASIANLGRARQFIAALKEIGCRFVLDDFGSGLSSFAYLRSLPVDFLKIDGEFVRHLTGDPVQRALVQSIHQVGHLMGLTTIAESVEDEATCAALREIGVDYGQGHWLGVPAPL